MPFVPLVESFQMVPCVPSSSHGVPVYMSWTSAWTPPPRVLAKGDPHLSSIPHGCTAHTWHGRSRLTGTPQRWALMISPLCICRRCGRDGRRGRCRRAGTQGQKRDRGGYTVSGYVSQVWEEVWEVSGADAAAAAAGRLPRSGFDIMAGARFVLQRGGGAVRSGPVAGGAA